MRVYHHDMPQNRLRADLHHRLRPELGLFAKTRAQPSAEDHHFHSAHSAACLKKLRTEPITLSTSASERSQCTGSVRISRYARSVTGKVRPATWKYGCR